MALESCMASLLSPLGKSEQKCETKQPPNSDIPLENAGKNQLVVLSEQIQCLN